MSIRILSLIWERAPHQGGALLTLLALADWSNDDGESWPSIRKLAAKARQSERNVRYILRELEAEDLLRVVTHPGLHHTNHYFLNLEKIQTLQPLQVLDENLQGLQPSENVTLQPATANPANCNLKTCKLQPASSDPSEDPEETQPGARVPEDVPACEEPTAPEVAIAGGEEESAVAGGEEDSALATFAPVLRRMPWDKPVPPEIAACPLCDCHGFAEAWDGAGTSWMLPCPHDSVRLRACAARHGYKLEREDLPRSREPPPLPPEGGPAP